MSGLWMDIGSLSFPAFFELTKRKASCLDQNIFSRQDDVPYMYTCLNGMCVGGQGGVHVKIVTTSPNNRRKKISKTVSK